MGRPKKPGEVFYLGRVRWVPGVDPPALREFLEDLADVEPGRKQIVIKAALTGGLEEGEASAALVEDEATTELLDELLADF